MIGHAKFKKLSRVSYNVSWSALVTNVILRVEVLYDRTCAHEETMRLKGVFDVI